MEQCPELEALISGGPQVEAHLEQCARCRIDRRFMLEAGIGVTSTFDLPDQPPASEVPDPGERYRVEVLLGRGGMGEVWRALDRELRRSVALKVLRHGSSRGDTLGRFVAEGRITAQLAHPGIIAVHDVGECADGRPYYTMDEVQGQTLKDVLPVRDEAGLRRCVDVLARVAEAMGYAHARGVLHRDLKPSNVMLGAFGQVTVMDWGLAGVRDAEAPVDAGDSAGQTVDGRVAGTAWYMPPEQAAGSFGSLAPSADVYALGAMLYELLYRSRPFASMFSAGQVLAALTTEGPPAPPSVEHAVPEELASLCAACMATEASDRPATGAAVAEGLRRWLDGVDRRARADAALERVSDRLAYAESLYGQAVAAATEAGELLNELKPWDPVEQKKPAWALEDQAEELRRQAAIAQIEFEQGVRGALEIDPEHEPALDALAGLFKTRLEAAEARKDTESAHRFAEMLRRHDHGRHAGWLSRAGAVTLVTDPPGADVVAYRLEEVDRRLERVESVPLGTTPLVEVALPPGSYKLVIRSPGKLDTTYPVFVERGEHWDGAPPEGGEPFPIELLPDEPDRDWEYVPTGWFISGGDPDAWDPLPRRRLWCDGFKMQRYPVTFGKYLEFLEDLMRKGDQEGVAEHMPRLPAGHGEEKALFEWDGGFRAVEVVDSLGSAELNHPASCVSWSSVRAFAEWVSDLRGASWALPHDQEWEKAARGVDGRAFPWGYHFDATWTCVAPSHNGPPRPASVETFPGDQSVYGIRGMAGNVREWCDNGYRRHGPPTARVGADENRGPYRMTRGGAYSSNADSARGGSRTVAPPEARARVFGVRLREIRPGTRSA